MRQNCCNYAYNPPLRTFTAPWGGQVLSWRVSASAATHWGTPHPETNASLNNLKLTTAASLRYVYTLTCSSLTSGLTVELITLSVHALSAPSHMFLGACFPRAEEVFRYFAQRGTRLILVHSTLLKPPLSPPFSSCWTFQKLLTQKTTNICSPTSKSWQSYVLQPLCSNPPSLCNYDWM